MGSLETISLIVTQCLGLPPLYSHPTIPFSVHYALNLVFRAQKPAPFTLCSDCTRCPLLLCSSGDVDVNPGHAVPSSTPIPQALSFVDFCNRKSLGFKHVNIRSLEVCFTHCFSFMPTRMSKPCLNPGLGKPPKSLTFPFLTITFSAKNCQRGGVAIYCKDSNTELCRHPYRCHPN